MSRDRRLHLVAFMRPVGIHTAWWRHSGGWPDANFNFERLATFALRRSATVTSFDPLTLRPALAVLTERIG